MKASSYLIPRCPGTSRLGEIGIADRLYFEIGLMLASDVVHGDLSPYNMLFDGVEPVIIDVPQAMPFSITPKAYGMAHRDLSNLDRFFEKQGLRTDFVKLLNKL